MGKTKIEWCDFTFNHIRCCTKVAEGCRFCYADALSKRNPSTLGIWGPNGTRVMAADAAWREPVKWNKAAGRQFDSWSNFVAQGHSEESLIAQGFTKPERPRVFCASLADVFEDWQGPMHDHHGEVLEEDSDAQPRHGVTMDDCRRRLFKLIDATPNLDWLPLTKRPENVRRMWPFLWGGHERRETRAAPDRSNVWLGTSIACRADLNNLHDIRESRDLASVLFVSAEPLIEDLGTVDLRGIDWVIIGGESGHDARTCNVAWIRSLVEQCKAAGVPAFVKQLGSLPFEDDSDLTGAPIDRSKLKRLPGAAMKHPKGGDPAEWPESLRVREFPSVGPKCTNCGRPVSADGLCAHECGSV